MTQITTYTELRAGIADWLNRSDLSDSIQAFIQLTESKFKRVLRTKHQTVVQYVTVADAGTVTIGATIENYEMFITEPVAKAGEIEPVSVGSIYRERARRSNVAGRPLFGAIIDTQLRLAPIPDDVYTIEIVGETIFVPLGPSQATNYILDDYPDVYLYGALMEAAPYLKHDERIPVWQTKFESALFELEQAQIRNEYPNTPVAKVPGNLAPILSHLERR